MFQIKPMSYPSSGEQYLNIKGGKLKTKFSIHEKNGVYLATSAKGNKDLVQLLDNLPYTFNRTERDSYYSWEIETLKIISLQNEVMRKFA
ncbi:hypothetical protein BCT84_20175 [Vibrio breoganii]|nr:hypothetical protein BCT84_20175 [Vibrio breoganii]